VQRQIALVEALGGRAVGAEGRIPTKALETLQGVSAVIWWGDGARDIVGALARRDGPILPLITDAPDHAHVAYERHLCVDTTAAGGNAALLAGGE
jgi:RHH-type proline utilization regulon transcriptional repressor/proline dehydrogenase/delta 1-pyrroline-5-carboxylate dehydrogenase